MNCTNCGSPLPPKSNICTYCESLNDTDLRAVTDRSTAGHVTLRRCPVCSVDMKRVDVSGHCIVERCDNCYGLFFDPNELESIVDESVSHVYDVDFKRLQNIIEEEGVEPVRPRRYVNCPVCADMMNRHQFGSRSGVIIDRCSRHGVWLDPGELNQILKWIKAGGRIHNEKKQIETLQQKRRALNAEIMAQDMRRDQGSGHYGLLPFALRAVGRLFL